MTSHSRRTHLDIFCKLYFAPGFQHGALQIQGDRSGASGRTRAPGSALPRIGTRGCGCDCTPAGQTAALCTPGCSTDIHHWSATCLRSSGQDRGHTRSSAWLCSAVSGRCQGDIYRTSADEKFLGHNEGTWEERLPGRSI